MPWLAQKQETHFHLNWKNEERINLSPNYKAFSWSNRTTGTNKEVDEVKVFG